MKKIVSILLSVVLVFSVFTFNNVSISYADTQEADWQKSAVISPKEGELIGAGYIDVEFDNSMEGYIYTVYLDGEPMYWIGDDIVRPELGEQITEEAVVKTFTSADAGKTEVYTTKVSKHELTIKASNGTDEYTSETRTFYVSKKGMALGGDMSDKITMKKLNCSWYYNWALNPFNNSIDEGVAHVPMMWGAGEDNIKEMESFTSDSNYILGFNEPDIESQANMKMFFDGIDAWTTYISPLNKRKISPRPAAPGGDSRWLKQFMTGDYKCRNPWDGTWALYSDYLDDATKTWVDGIGDDVDSVVLHYYRNRIDLNGIINAVNKLWETYHKPIWITEISVFGVKGTPADDFSYEIPSRRKEMAEYVKGIVENLDAMPYVERYCWFSYDIDSTNEIDSYNGSGATCMFEYSTGLYTQLGRLYSTIGNPAGYNATVITDEEMYVDAPEETTTVETTTKKPEITTKPQVTTKVEKPTVKKPAKVKLSKATNIKKKSVKLIWKKVTGAKKYQVQYALNKKFTKKLKTKTTTKLTLKIAKLTKKKKYYFRVRAINSAGKGSWSNMKNVKIKK